MRAPATCVVLVAMGIGACGGSSGTQTPPDAPACQADAIWTGYGDTWLRATDGRYWSFGRGGGGTIRTTWPDTSPAPKPFLQTWVPSGTRDLNVRSGIWCVLSTTNALHCAYLLGVPDATTKTVDAVAAAAFSPEADGQEAILMVDGSVWGFADGAGATTTQVLALGNTVVSVAVGMESLCALEKDASVWCWGSGYLGDGHDAYDLATPQEPKQVLLPAGAAAIAAGFDASCAILNDASVWCWGSRQFGAGARSGVPPWFTPQAVPIGDVKALAMGAFQACALKNDGTLWCWGSNFYGESGYEPVGEAGAPTWDVPKQVAALGSDVKYVSTGFQHTCAVKNDATVWCWGNSGAGQVGNDTLTNPSPVVLKGCQ